MNRTGLHPRSTRSVPQGHFLLGVADFLISFGSGSKTSIHKNRAYNRGRVRERGYLFTSLNPDKVTCAVELDGETLAFLAGHDPVQFYKGPFVDYSVLRRGDHDLHGNLGTFRQLLVGLEKNSAGADVFGCGLLLALVLVAVKVAGSDNSNLSIFRRSINLSL